MKMQSTVTLNISEYNEILINSTICQQYKEENSQLKEENKLLKMQKLDLPDEVKFYDTPYGKIVMINGKQIKLKNGNIQLCNKKNDTPTYTVKLDGSEVYEAVKKATDEVMKELEKEELQQPKTGNPIREVGMGNVKIVGSSEDFKNKLVVEYPESIMLCDKDNPEKKVVFNSKGIHLYRRDTLISSTTK